MSVRPARFGVESEVHAGMPTVRMDGELDLAALPEAEDALTEARDAGASRLVVDLRRLTFIDSSGLRLLILLADAARREGWELSLVPPPAPANNVFLLTGADLNLPFVEEPPTA
jgi:anti-sigma B factor antagonist